MKTLRFWIVATVCWVTASFGFSKQEERRDYSGPDRTHGTYYGLQVIGTSPGLPRNQPQPRGLVLGTPGTSGEIKRSDRLLKMEWAEIVPAPPARIYARKGANEPWMEFTVTRKGEGLEVSKPRKTDYVRIEKLRRIGDWRQNADAEPAVVGLKAPVVSGAPFDVELIGPDREVTPLRVAAMPLQAGPRQVVARLPDDAAGQHWIVVSTDGRTRSQRFAGMVELYPTSGGLTREWRYAAMVIAPGRYHPLLPDGTPVPLETEQPGVKAKAYRSPPGMEWQDQRATLMSWAVEYDVNGTVYLGWASPDLKTHTGPVWKTLRREPAMLGAGRKDFGRAEAARSLAMNRHDYQDKKYRREVYLGELRDGSWMVYYIAQVTGRYGEEVAMPEPTSDDHAPTIDGAFANAEPYFAGVVRREAAKQAEAAAFTRQIQREWDEARAKVFAEWGATKATPEVQAKVWKLAFEKSESTARELATQLGGDYWIRNEIRARRRTGQAVPAEWLASFAERASDPEFKRSLLGELQTVQTRQADNERREAERVAEERRKAEIQATEDAAVRRSLAMYQGLSKPTMTLREWETSSNAYFKALNDYTYGKQDWKPIAPRNLQHLR